MAAKLATALEDIMSCRLIDPDAIDLSWAKGGSQAVDPEINVLTMVKESLDRRDNGNAEDSIVYRAS